MLSLICARETSRPIIAVMIATKEISSQRYGPASVIERRRTSGLPILFLLQQASDISVSRSQAEAGGDQNAMLLNWSVQQDNPR
ncbi:MAG TPA: hypothetical protein VGO54_03110, partial [Bradyrhizobium sp.]|nr:hypothetical protein [Bradyrhizobium sp.]